MRQAKEVSAYARTHGDMSVTGRTSAGLFRLPLYGGMPAPFADRVIDRI